MTLPTVLADVFNFLAMALMLGGFSVSVILSIFLISALSLIWRGYEECGFLGDGSPTILWFLLSPMQWMILATVDLEIFVPASAIRFTMALCVSPSRANCLTFWSTIISNFLAIFL